MEVYLTPEQETKLAEIAKYEGKNAEELAREAVLRLIEDDEDFLAGVHRGIEQADRGELIEHDEVKARIERVIRG